MTSFSQCSFYSQAIRFLVSSRFTCPFVMTEADASERLRNFFYENLILNEVLLLSYHY